MSETFEIGVKLALSDGVSDGIARARKEMAAFENVLTTGGVSVGQLRKAAQEALSLSRIHAVAEQSETRSSKPGLHDGSSGLTADTAGLQTDRQQEEIGRVAGNDARVSSQDVSSERRPMSPSDALAAAPAQDGVFGVSPSRPSASLPALSVESAPVQSELDHSVMQSRVPVPTAISAPSGSRTSRDDDRRPASSAPTLTYGPMDQPDFHLGDDGRSRTTAMTVAPVVLWPQQGSSEVDSQAAPTIVAPAEKRGFSGDGNSFSAPYPAGAPAAPEPGHSAYYPWTQAPGSAPREAPVAPDPSEMRAPAPQSSGSQGTTSGERQPTEGDVFLDGMLVGRWMSRFLAQEAGRASAGPTGFDARRGRLLPGPTVGN